ncbi:MAG: hypothetical protein ACLQDL_17030 [Spirochaetia bacterium]
MHHDGITSLNRPHNRFRGQHLNEYAARLRDTRTVTTRPPASQTLLAHEKRESIFGDDHDAGRQFGQPGDMRALPPPIVKPLGVQDAIDLIGGKRRRGDQAGIRRSPGLAKQAIPRALALGAWPMAGRHRRRLIQEEELGVPARAHDRAVPPPELENAGDPPSAGEREPDTLPVVVQAAAVAHECSSG